VNAATRSAAIGDTPLLEALPVELADADAVALELLEALALELEADVELFEELWPPELLHPAAVRTDTTAAVTMKVRNPLLDIESPTLR
jgi:hypothetical protein